MMSTRQKTAADAANIDDGRAETGRWQAATDSKKKSTTAAARLQGNVFREVRERVTAEDAARLYGVEVGRYGKALCPFHLDRHPSMTFKNGRYRCWVCNIGGDSIDLTERLLGVAPMDAVRRLNADFALGLAIDREQTAEEHRAARARLELAEEHRRFEAWRKDYINRLNAVYRRGYLALKSGQEPDDGDAEAVRYMATAEYYADALSFGTPQEQAQIYRERGLIGRWIDRSLKN